MAAIVSRLEPSVDEFATSIHALASYQKVASGLANETLSHCARILDEREAVGMKRANTPGDRNERERDAKGSDAGEEGLRPVLRELSRMIER